MRADRSDELQRAWITAPSSKPEEDKRGLVINTNASFAKAGPGTASGRHAACSSYSRMAEYLRCRPELGQ
jgi:hypothetical protein